MDVEIKQLEKQMAKAIDILKTDLSSIRAGRANSSLIDHVKIKAYGGTQELTLEELATIGTVDATTMTVAPYDPSIIDEIEKGLGQANLGVSIASDGEIIRVTVPPMTEERRDEFIKLAKAKTEGIKVMIRQIRQDAVGKVRDQFQKKEIAEDAKFHMEKEIQSVTDDHVEKAESLLKSKTEELSIV